MTMPDHSFDLASQPPAAGATPFASGFALSIEPGIPADPQLLLRNLAALAQRQPALAQRLAQHDQAIPLVFTETEEGVPSAELEGKALASRRRPLSEARRLAERIDIHEHGGLLVMGLGVGHHVGAIVERVGEACAVVVFEPDLALLRAVFERIDHTAWLARHTTVIVTDPDDVGALSADLKDLEALLSVGIEIIEHAPSASRLADRSTRMFAALNSAVGAMRMHVITALVQSDVTVRNELMNIGHYVERPGIDDLEGLCAGHPAILVAAGPSLRTSIEPLRDPAVRERCVIIGVQTVLRPLLEAGITPHFVTAIDYHEISKRFYEGLTEHDVEGVTLVAEARANGAILDAFPGDIRLPRDDFLDRLLGAGPEHDGADRGKLTAAATVAHLSYYLARYMGCDPVMLVGQDLAFTDGQYYGPGAAIHSVWAPELNAFSSLERLEWERIVRNKGHLHRVTDVLGRSVYTDDQMAAYLAQFERDFAPDRERGLSVIDASEGVSKRHTTPMPLREALARYASSETPRLPAIPGAPLTGDTRSRRATADRLHKVKRQTRAIARCALEGRRELDTLLERQEDRAHNDATVERIHALRNKAEGQQPAFALLSKMNQLGGFKRFKADRAIALAQHESRLVEQRARIERDQANLEWLEQYAELFEELLAISERALHGGPKRTRDITPVDDEGSDQDAAHVRIGALLHTGMGTSEPATVERTLRRLARVRPLDAVVLLTDTPERYQHLDTLATIDRVAPVDPAIRRSLRAGRAWARDGWRSGLAGLTAADEAIEPVSFANACERHGLDGAYIVGPDWSRVDPALSVEVIERHREAPASHPIVFTQAPPGLCGVLVRADALHEMCEGRTKSRGSMFATLGGVVGYVPLAPRHDPIARSGCVQIDPVLRDRALRCIEEPGDAEPSDPDADALTISAASERRFFSEHPAFPTELVLELNTERHAFGARYESLAPGALPDRTRMSRDRAFALVDAFAERSPGGVLSLEGLGDPLLVEWAGTLIEHARSRSLLTHLRTDLMREGDTEDVLACAPDVVSVEGVSSEAVVYHALVGVDAFDRVKSNIERLLEERRLVGGLPTMWVVPRITKRDAVYEQVEYFYDYWLTIAGAASIDPLPHPIPGERLAPLPVPERVRERDRRRRMIVRSDGVVLRDPDWFSDTAGAPIGPDPFVAWRSMFEAGAMA